MTDKGNTPDRSADRSRASGTAGDLAPVAKSTNGRIPKVKRATKRTPEEQRAEIERVARAHGADLSEEGFNEVLRKVGGAGLDRAHNGSKKV